jgi:hypothetical protein
MSWNNKEEIYFGVYSEVPLLQVANYTLSDFIFA